MTHTSTKCSRSHWSLPNWLRPTWVEVSGVYKGSMHFPHSDFEDSDARMTPGFKAALVGCKVIAIIPFMTNLLKLVAEMSCNVKCDVNQLLQCMTNK